MALTPTRRRNGPDMVTVKVTHHLTKGDLHTCRACARRTRGAA